MDALATVDDVRVRLSTPLTNNDLVRVAALIDDASSATRQVARQWISRITTTGRHPITIMDGCLIVRLPQRPVNAITSVIDEDGKSIDYVWDGFDVLALSSHTGFVSPFISSWVARRLGSAIVTYDHGYDDTNDPNDVLGTIRGVIAGGIVSRAFGTGSDQQGKTAESIGTYSYTIGASAAQGAYGLLSSEVEAIETAVGRRARKAGTVAL